MKRTFAAIVLALMVWPVAVGAQSLAKSADGFDRLKILVGDWVATGEDGKPFTNNIRLVSNGTALQETFQTDQDNQMITMYSANGSRVALTHYCSMGNQPRMETPAVAGATDEFVFSFTGATNLPTLDASHHFSETWTFREKKGDNKRTFNFVRKK
jgi:hypothetical protein